MQISHKFIAGFLILALFGAGCQWFNNTTQEPADLDAFNQEVKGLTSAEVAARINFSPGSQLEIRQTYLGLGAKLADKLADGSKDGVRIVTIERFAPANSASLKWQLTQKVETEASIQARDAYNKEKETAPIGSDLEEPEIQTEEQTVAGGLDDIDLKNSHSLFIPAYWPPEKIGINNNSAIWVSDDVYRELTRTRVSTIYFGLLDSSLFGAMVKAKEFADAVNALQSESVAAKKNQIEVDLVNADADFADWDLNVNGKDVKVQVIKARNWFGEIVVLNNPQNPLILKITFNPLSTGALDLISGTGFLKSLLGYEVTSISGVQ